MTSFKKQDLVNHLQEEFKDHKFTDAFLKKIIDDIFDTISYEAVTSSSIVIPNFGKFVLKSYGSENHKKLGFLPSRCLKKKVNNSD